MTRLSMSECGRAEYSRRNRKLADLRGLEPQIRVAPGHRVHLGADEGCTASGSRPPSDPPCAGVFTGTCSASSGVRDRVVNSHFHFGRGADPMADFGGVAQVTKPFEATDEQCTTEQRTPTRFSRAIVLCSLSLGISLRARSGGTSDRRSIARR